MEDKKRAFFGYFRMDVVSRKIRNILHPAVHPKFFAIALLWYLAYIAYHDWGMGFISAYPSSDAELYDHYAWYKAFIDGAGGTLGKVIPPSVYVTLLELAYILTGPQFITPFLLNAIALSAACVFLTKLSSDMFGKTVGYMAGILFLLCGPVLFYVGLSMKSASVILFLTASLYFLYKSIQQPRAFYLVTFSAFIALLCIDRNNFLLSFVFIPLLAIKCATDKKSIFKNILLLYLPLIGIIVVFNNAQSQSSPTSPIGVNFYIGNSASATGAYTNLKNIRNNLIGHHIDMVIDAEANSARHPGRLGTQIYWVKTALGEHADNPVGLLRLEVKKLLMLFARDAPGSPEQYSLWRWHDPFLSIAVIDYAVVLSLAIPGIFLLWKQPDHKDKRAHMLIPVIYAMMLIPFFITERFRLPVLVSLIPFAAYTLRTLTSKDVTLKNRTIIAGVSIAAYVCSSLLVTIISYGPGWPIDPEGKRKFEITSNKYRQEIYRLKRQAILKNDRYSWDKLHNIYSVTALKEDAEEFRLRAQRERQ